MTIDQEPKTNDLSSKEDNKQLIYGLPLIHWVTGSSCFVFTVLMYFWFETDRLSGGLDFCTAFDAYDSRNSYYCLCGCNC